jgi:hypothetical protein
MAPALPLEILGNLIMSLQPFSCALLFVWLCSLAFEPVRQSLWRLGDSVGGVGGIGGLSNQNAPSRNCTVQSAAADLAYCFDRGIVAGMTPLALVVVLCFCAPFVAAALWSIAYPRVDEPRELAAASSSSVVRVALRAAWVVSLGVWFVVPLAEFLSDPFYYVNWYYTVLGIAIPASIPLSWILSFVALPTSGPLAHLLGDELGNRAQLAGFHRFIGCSVAVFGGVHAVGELTFMIANNDELWRYLTLSHPYSDVNVIYVLGVAATFIGLATVVVGLQARRIFGRWWALSHRTLALLTMMVSAGHFWAFALLFLPAQAFHGAALGIMLHSRGRSLAQKPTHSKRTSAACVLVALCANLIAFIVVWDQRAAYMSQKSADLYTPFVFPPLSVFSGLAFSAATVWLLLVAFDRVNQNLSRERVGDGDEDALLINTADEK